MAKFMIMGSYTADGANGLLKDGGSRRKSAVEQMVSHLGGKLEAFSFAFGESDIFAIVDVPDTTSGAAGDGPAAHGALRRLRRPRTITHHCRDGFASK